MSYEPVGGGCNNAKSSIHPGAPELVNGIGCNGPMDETAKTVSAGSKAAEGTTGGLKVKRRHKRAAFYDAPHSPFGLPDTFRSARVRSRRGNIFAGRTSPPPALNFAAAGYKK